MFRFFFFGGGGIRPPIIFVVRGPESILKSLLLLHLLFGPTKTLKKGLPFMLFLIETVGIKIIDVSLALMMSST